MKKIITYGTFDVIHEGHLNILKRAKALGDYLIVGISSDEHNKRKNKKSYQNFNERKKILEGIKYVDEVISEDNWDQKVTDIKKYNIHTFIIGDDWEGEFDDLKKYCNVLYVPRTEGISSSKIRKNIFSLYLDKIYIGVKNNSHNFTKIHILFLSLIYIPLLFILSYIVAKDKGLYIFGSMNAQNISGNSKAMFNYYGKSKRCFYMTKNTGLINNNVINIYGLKAILLILKAEYIFTDASASSVSPSIALLGKFKIIRLWHGDTIKKINFDSKKYISSIGIIGRFLLTNEYKNNLIIPVCSDINKKIMNSAFLGDIAKVTGLPRNDIFFNSNNENIINKVHNQFNVKQYSKIFLYTPTWRDSKSTIKPFSSQVLRQINNLFEQNNFLLIISGHIQTEEISFEETSHIKNFKSSNIDIQELLVIANILITDYSSIYIDFLLTNKPIIFYSYDLEEYLNQDRELCFDYKSVIIEESLVSNEYDLLDTLKSINTISEDKKYQKKYKEVKNFFHKNQNGGYCKNVDNSIKQ